MLRIFAAIAMIAGISLTTLGTASTASADSGICDVSNGYQKDDGGGTITGAFGSLSWSKSSSTLSYDIKAGYTVEICLKAGAGTDAATVKTVTGPEASSFSTGTGKEVSHVGYRVTATPPTDVCTNLEGNQANVPDGYTESDGICTQTPPPTDVCTNLEGNQATVPAGYTATNGVCAEVLGTEESAGPSENGNDPEVEGISAGRSPATVKGTEATVKGTSSVVPNAIDAGLAGAQSDVRLLVGQALVGVGLLLATASLWSGPGLRRRGGVQA